MTYDKNQVAVNYYIFKLLEAIIMKLDVHLLLGS